MITPECPKCKTNKWINISTHGQWNHCENCGSYIRKATFWEEYQQNQKNKLPNLK